MEINQTRRSWGTLILSILYDLRLFSSPWCDKQCRTCWPKYINQHSYAEDLLKTQKQHNAHPIPTTLQVTVRDPQSNEAPVTHMNVKALPWLKKLYKRLSAVLPCTEKGEDTVLPFYCLLAYLISLMGIIQLADPPSIQPANHYMKNKAAFSLAQHICKSISVVNTGKLWTNQSRISKKDAKRQRSCILRLQVSEV